MKPIDYRTSPHSYKHWCLEVKPPVAYLHLDVDEEGGLAEGYLLKLNSYDLGVDIELNDAIQRLRFEHPAVRTVVVTSAKDRVFCAGANIGMLAGADHSTKVNFCKFTNETRNSIEDSTRYSGQRYICAIRGTAAGGGYELALATDHIMLVDDGSSAVSLPEVPLLAVLPGTGGLTRLVDKRFVRRDHADVFCTVEEGVRGRRALEWRMVDELVGTSRFEEIVRERALEFADEAGSPVAHDGIKLKPIERDIVSDKIEYDYVRALLDHSAGTVEFFITGPAAPAPTTIEALVSLGSESWILALARQLDDLVLHLRTNEPELGTWIFRSSATRVPTSGYDQLLEAHGDHWLAREITLYWRRLLKRIDITSRSLIALVEPDSCFDGTLLELVLAADQSFMLDGDFEIAPGQLASVELGEMNFGPLSTLTGLSRLEARHLSSPQGFEQARSMIGKTLGADDALRLGLVTFAPDDIDWHDEVRLVVEARTSFSPDALSAMEANLRFAGPETMESKIFARLSAWQNWVFQRPNAVGEAGALTRYGSGQRAQFDKRRV